LNSFFGIFIGFGILNCPICIYVIYSLVLLIGYLRLDGVSSLCIFGIFVLVTITRRVSWCLVSCDWRLGFLLVIDPYSNLRGLVLGIWNR
jgi:hypothetical protein